MLITQAKIKFLNGYLAKLLEKYQISHKTPLKNIKFYQKLVGKIFCPIVLAILYGVFTAKQIKK